MRDLRVNWICKLPFLVDKVRAWNFKQSHARATYLRKESSDAGANDHLVQNDVCYNGGDSSSGVSNGFS
jgi:hypothetical protein